MTMLDEALKYAALDWPIFPLAGKIPRTKYGLRDATTDEKQIWQWWRQWPEANIGFALLPGQLVIDVDPRHSGSENMARLTSEYGPIPDTITAISGREDGGCHFYLLRPPGKLTDRRLPEGIDIRVGGKHYVVAPPSIHPDTGRAYYWAVDPTTEIAVCPRWLTDLIRVPITVPPAPRASADGTGDGLVSFVADLKEGNRNHGLYWAARSAVDDHILDQHLAERLIAAAEHCGLTRAEAEATIHSAERAA